MSGPARALAGLCAAASLGTAALSGCQERLTQPVECPALCPGGIAPAIDTVLAVLPGTDSSYGGYVSASTATALLVSNGLVGSQSRAVYRFAPRRDSVTVADTNRGYLVDSVLIAVSLRGRDTLLDGLKLLVYRIDPGVGPEITFAALEPQLVESNLIDSVPVPDTLNVGTVRLVLRGEDVLKTGLRRDVGGTLAVGIAMASPLPSGVRLGALLGNTAAGFVSYVTAQNVPDTATGRQQSIEVPTAFNTFVTESAAVPDPDLLTVGGEPSSRALLRFDLPERLEDSATIVRATLELPPVRPVSGLPGDPALLVAKAVLADLGAKSPVSDDVSTSGTLAAGTTDAVQLDVTELVRFWQSTSVERPESIFLSVSPEASTFIRAELGSSRRPDIGQPRLRVTYTTPFPFENP